MLLLWLVVKLAKRMNGQRRYLCFLYKVANSLWSLSTKENESQHWKMCVSVCVRHSTILMSLTHRRAHTHTEDTFLSRQMHLMQLLISSLGRHQVHLCWQSYQAIAPPIQVSVTTPASRDLSVIKYVTVTYQRSTTESKSLSTLLLCCPTKATTTHLANNSHRLVFFTDWVITQQK